jgi:hypothetical protein
MIGVKAADMILKDAVPRRAIGDAVSLPRGAANERAAVGN